MNKLIQVNIGGLVFQIDEGAYQKLDNYLSAIRIKYAKEPGGDDILHDIEARIAELFLEKSENNRAIMQKDVDDIIELMGQPDDFDADEQEEPVTSREKSNRSTRRFFRDGDNRQLGGVCSGFGAYFDVDPLWIRLAFVAAFFFGGSGILLYIVLWIIMPEAKTAAEKLEMRGESVNISNIEKTVRGSARQVQQKAAEFSDEVKQVFSEENVSRTKNSVGGALESFIDMLRPVVRLLMQIFIFGIVVACLIALVAIGIAFLTDAGQPAAQINFALDHFFETARQGNILIGGALALVAIPLLSLLVRGIKFLLNVKVSFKAFDWTMLLLWLTCLSAVIVVGIQLGRDFEDSGRTSETINLQQPSVQPLVVKVDDYEERQIRQLLHFDHNWSHVQIYEDTAIFCNIDLMIESSDDSLYSLTMIRSAQGSSRELARSRAEQMTYTITQKDNLLLIPSIIHLNEGELWRNQQVDLILRVPQNTSIVLDVELEDYLRYNDNTESLNRHELFGPELMMTPVGLKPVY